MLVGVVIIEALEGFQEVHNAAFHILDPFPVLWKGGGQLGEYAPLEFLIVDNDRTARTDDGFHTSLSQIVPAGPNANRRNGWRVDVRCRGTYKRSERYGF